jgi:hypothetical protein
MHLPEEVHRRLAVRAVTDLDVANLLAIYTTSHETVSEPLIDQAMGDEETRE